MRQNLPGLPGRYEGSIYPKTWGELEQKGFSTFGLNAGLEGYDEFAEFHFPHPPRKKVECKASEIKPIEAFPGFQGWLEISGTKDELREIGTEGLLALMLKHGAVEGSRVTTRTIHDETTRASEITEAKTTYGKVKVWAENTGIEIPEDAEEKIAVLDAESERKGLVHKPRKWKLDRLELRGSIGIWKGQRKEEVVIDFEALDPGTIALLGGNGAGKSTIVKNCNPYPDPIGAERKYQDLFYLRDSHSVSYWCDTATGEKIKAVKMINGSAASGSNEFFLYRMNGAGYEPYNEEATSGRKAGYEAAVMELFGTPEIFTRSAYIAQGGADMPSSPKERKEFFNELLGNEYLGSMSLSAKTRADGIDSEIKTTAGKIEGLRYGLDQESVIRPERRAKVIEVVEQKTKLVTVTDNGQAAKANLENLKKEKVENDRLLHEIGTLEGNIANSEHQIKELEGQVLSLETALQGIPAAEAALAQDEANRKRLDELRAEKARLDEANEEVRTEYNLKVDEVRLKRREAEKAVQEAESQIIAINQQIKALESEGGTLSQKKTTIDTPCPQCGYLAEDVQLQLADIESRIEEITEELTDAHTALDDASAESAGATEALQKIKDPEEPVYQGLDMPSITLLPDSQVNSLRLKIETGQTAKAQIEAKREQVGELNEKITADRERLEEKNRQVDLFIDQKVKAAEQVYEDRRQEYQDLTNTITRLEAEITSLEKQLEGITKRREEITRLEEEISGKKSDLTTWRFLQRALGRDGVQALELDALAPSIAEVANRLLQRAYGPRFEMEFRTTRDAGTGKNRHQAEDFEIYIHDHEEAEPSLQVQTLGTMSGGERVWIMKALCDAFGIIREKNTGLQYMTTFQDEADGALSPEKKHLYLQMVEAAHVESGRHQTIYVTHDIGIQDAIPQRILVREL